MGTYRLCLIAFSRRPWAIRCHRKASFEAVRHLRGLSGEGSGKEEGRQ
ncbi:hypothetical protein N5E15_15800 [Pantoea stewartii]|nr:hypothetical protein [Pantoea stewartii]MCU7368051.1 hypothetical protein [Pantoea stewartii]